MNERIVICQACGYQWEAEELVSFREEEAVFWDECPVCGESQMMDEGTA